MKWTPRHKQGPTNRLIEFVIFVAMVGFTGIRTVAQHVTASGVDRTSKAIDTREAKQSESHAHKNKITINVDCGNPSAKVKTINSGLSLLGDTRPAILLISGTCHENVVISGLDRVTLQGNPTATIDGGSDPIVGTVEIFDSQDVSLVNLTITAGGEGVGCFGQSLCRLTQVTVQNSLADGVGVAGRSHAQIVDTSIRNNGDVGLFLGPGSVNFFGGSVNGNASDGIVVRNAAYLGIGAGDLFSEVTIQNNLGSGIRSASHSTVALGASNIAGNAGDGVSLQSSSEMTMTNVSVVNNQGHQVRIGDLSFVRFAGFQSNTILGANKPDVVCDPQFSTTRDFANLAGATTNCPAELPPTP